MAVPEFLSRNSCSPRMPPAVTVREFPSPKDTPKATVQDDLELS